MFPVAIQLLAAAALTLPAVAQAQGAAPKFRPGLWEHGYTMKSQSGQMEAAMKKMQDALAKMPPEQRKMMQDMMARQGMSIGGTGQTMAVKTCITPEQAARDLASSGIRVATILPGLFETPMFASIADDYRRALEQSVPHPSRLGRPAGRGRGVSFAGGAHTTTRQGHHPCVFGRGAAGVHQRQFPLRTRSRRHARCRARVRS
jgi:hypothetical protein